jgi:hypothetical protein
MTIIFFVFFIILDYYIKMSVKVLFKATVYNQILDVLGKEFASVYLEKAIAIIKEFDLDEKFHKAILYKAKSVPYDILGKYITLVVKNSAKHFSLEKDFQIQLLNLIGAFVELYKVEKHKLIDACKLFSVRQLKVIELVSDELINDLVDDKIDAYEELFKILDVKLELPEDWNN